MGHFMGEREGGDSYFESYIYLWAGGSIGLHKALIIFIRYPRHRFLYFSSGIGAGLFFMKDIILGMPKIYIGNLMSDMSMLE